FLFRASSTSPFAQRPAQSSEDCYPMALFLIVAAPLGRRGSPSHPAGIGVAPNLLGSQADASAHHFAWRKTMRALGIVIGLLVLPLALPAEDKADRPKLDGTYKIVSGEKDGKAEPKSRIEGAVVM